MAPLGARYPSSRGERRPPCCRSLEAPMPTSAARTILIVDDEDGIRITLRRQLTAQGHTVLEASHGIEALSIVRMQPDRVELVLADVVMPRMNGTELAGSLQAEYPQLPVILMSA